MHDQSLLLDLDAEVYYLICPFWSLMCGKCFIN